MSQGHVKRRRGILGHLQDGRITLLEEGAHDVISMRADKATGIWRGSARAFAANCGAGDVSERQARNLLESLETKKYIRRFATKGKRGNYPILVNKYEVTFGARSGMRLNAEASDDWRNPVYESCQVQGEVRGEVDASSQEERREKGEAEGAATPSTDPEAWTWIGLGGPVGTLKFQSAFLFYYGSKNGHLRSEVMEQTIQRCQNTGLKVPPPFYEAKRHVEEREKAPAVNPESDSKLLTASDMPTRER